MRDKIQLKGRRRLDESRQVKPNLKKIDQTRKNQVQRCSLTRELKPAPRKTKFVKTGNWSNSTKISWNRQTYPPSLPRKIVNRQRLIEMTPSWVKKAESSLDRMYAVLKGIEDTRRHRRACVSWIMQNVVPCETSNVTEMKGQTRLGLKGAARITRETCPRAVSFGQEGWTYCLETVFGTSGP